MQPKEREHTRTMNTYKSIGGAMLGIAAFVGVVIAIVLFFTLGATVAFAIAPFVNWLAGVLFLINLVALLFALIPKARGAVGLTLFISSFVYGLSAWIYGLAVTLSLWGWFAVLLGIFLGGVGVVPIGMLAAIFHGEWSIFWSLLLTVVLTYGSRAIGYALASSVEAEEERGDIIDIEPEDDDDPYHQETNDTPKLRAGKTRGWGDLE